MDCVIVYETMWGNARSVAEAIAEGIHGASVLPVHAAGSGVADADLLIVGGPTHARGLSFGLSRRMAIQAASESLRPLDPEAARAPTLRHWLRALPTVDGRRALAFDTRRDRPQLLTGSAAHAIARRLRQRGYDVSAAASFFIEASDGPLRPGELARARAWGALHAGHVTRGRAGETG